MTRSATDTATAAGTRLPHPVAAPPPQLTCPQPDSILRVTSDWLRRRAGSRSAPLLLFVWAFAEALVWPIIPDASLGILALSRPGRWWLLTLSTAAGSVAGGAAGWWATVQGWSWPQLLTTPRMHAAADTWLGAGASGLAHQPLSGVPYKVFVAAAPEAGVGVTDLATATLRYRGLRFAITAAVAAAVGALLWRCLPQRWQREVHAVVSAAAVVVLLTGLALVVRGWS
jgi:membrane protein YqaA with SNARE-associated domain